MKKQIIHSLLLVIFFNYVMGCSTYSIEMKKTSMVSQEETIDSIVLTNMEPVIFNSNGAQIQKKTFLEAILENGEPFSIAKDKIKYYRVTKPDAYNIDEIENHVIREALLMNNMYVIFDENGGKIEHDSLLSGRSIEGIEFKLKLKRIEKFYTEYGENATEKNIIEGEKKLKQIISEGNNYIYSLNEDSIKFVERTIIQGITESNKKFQANVDSVLYANVKKFSTANTILAFLGGALLFVGVLFVIAIATKESCPFIYSFDGEKYLFDAEPLGGATSLGLARTEYSKLDYLKPINEEYKILIRNEVEETQYIDELGILAVIHDNDKKVYTDLEGNFYQVKNPVKPIEAFNEKNQNLLKLVSNEDNFHWETKLPMNESELTQNFNHEIKIVFPRYKDQDSVKLIANIGTSLWGSRMIKEMLQLYGNNVDSYYEKINELGSEYHQMMNFIENEELYKLKYYTFNGETWDYQGFINGGGPFVSETRVYNLDISKIKSDSIVIKINPPFGFWTIDYLALEFENYEIPKLQPLEFVKAINDEDENITSKLITTDKIFYEMPKVGDSFEAYYKLNNEINRGRTTYYLKSNGYYEIHLDKTINPQLTTLMKMSLEKGYIVKLSNQKFKEFVKEQLN